MPYVLPQTLVFQDFTTQPAVAANPLSAHVSGGHAYLVRVSDTDEKEFGRLGLYDNVVENDYLWPNRPAGGVVDTSFTRLFIENALLHYYADALSSGSAITVSGTNRIVAASVNFQTKNGYSRDAELFDRDVAVGDVIRVRGIPTNGDGAVTTWATVKAIIEAEVDGVVSAAVSDAANKSNQGASVAVSKVSGATNTVVATANGASYDGTPTGNITEVYTITVTDSSVGGDHTTANLRVTSASGLDDDYTVSPSADGVATAIGTRGLTVTFASSASAALSQSAENEEVADDDLIAGQVWSVTVNQAFTKPVATSGGTYSKAASTTYIITVTKGGGMDSVEPAEIFITTTTGSDQSGPHVVEAAATDVAIGTDEVVIQFSGTKLSKGDRYYIDVTGTSGGPVRTLELSRNLDSTYEVGDEVGIDLYIRNPLLEVTANRYGAAPLTNWEQSDTEITVSDGITAYDATWTDGGVALPLPVVSSETLEYGVLYVEYRAWLQTFVGQVESMSDVANIDDISGALDPENPLKWGVFKALSNSNGTPVLYTAVSDPNDVDAWPEVLEALLAKDNAYGLVPLTKNRTVQDLFAAHVNSASSPTEGLWRSVWFSLSGIPEIPIVSAGGQLANYLSATTTDGESALATFLDDPETAGSQYTICYVSADNAGFLVNGVRAGDIVRALYSGDGFGVDTYEEYVVDEVQSENQLRVVTGPSAPQSVPAKIEIWRNLSATEEATEIALAAGSWGNRRVRAVWPDQIESSGTLQEGYHVCAALAGLASGVLPHQGLTHVAITGFSSTQRTNDKFNKPQLDIMAASGVWVVQQQLDGTIFTRHAVTTGDYEDINQREEMLTRNVDSISYRFKDYFAPFIGKTNVTPTMKLIILGGAEKLIRVLTTERLTAQLGGQLIGATVDRFEISEIFKDRYVAYITMTVPYALNNIELHLIV